MDEEGSGSLGALLLNLQPYQAVLLAAVFSIAISEGLTEDESNILALFFSTVASNIGLINQLLPESATEDLPGIV